MQDVLVLFVQCTLNKQCKIFDDLSALLGKFGETECLQVTRGRVGLSYFVMLSLVVSGCLTLSCYRSLCQVVLLCDVVITCCRPILVFRLLLFL